MKNDFQITPLSDRPFTRYFSMSARDLREQNAALVEVDSHPGFPCRVSLQDAAIGETVLLIEHTHLDVRSPYRGSGPIIIRKDVRPAELEINEIPKMLLHRTLSLRGYDADGFMRGAATISGRDLPETISELFALPAIEHLDIHNAGPGCFDCRVHRAASEPGASTREA